MPVTDFMFSEGSPQVLVCNSLGKSGNDKICCINSRCIRRGVKQHVINLNKVVLSL